MTKLTESANKDIVMNTGQGDKLPREATVAKSATVQTGSKERLPTKVLTLNPSGSFKIAMRDILKEEYAEKYK